MRWAAYCCWRAAQQEGAGTRTQELQRSRTRTRCYDQADAGGLLRPGPPDVHNDAKHLTAGRRIKKFRSQDTAAGKPETAQTMLDNVYKLGKPSLRKRISYRPCWWQHRKNLTGIQLRCTATCTGEWRWRIWRLRVLNYLHIHLQASPKEAPEVEPKCLEGNANASQVYVTCVISRAERRSSSNAKQKRHKDTESKENLPQKLAKHW